MSTSKPTADEIKKHLEDLKQEETEEKQKEQKRQLALLGAMYHKFVLDCVIDAAYAISYDFVLRPEIYKRFEKDATATNLNNMRRLSGFHPDYPNKEVRINEIYLPIFGNFSLSSPMDKSSQFALTRNDLINAAKAYSENQLDATKEALKTRVRISAKRFRSYLKSISGVSQKISNENTSAIFELSEKILKDNVIRELWGVSENLDANWPLEVEPDPNGSTLIQNIFAQQRDYISNSYTDFKAGHFENLQSIGTAGHDAIDQAIHEKDKTDEDDEFGKFAGAFYTWGGELGIIK